MDEELEYCDPMFLNGEVNYEMALDFIRFDSYGVNIPRRAKPYVSRILRTGKYLACLVQRRRWVGMEADPADDAKIDSVRIAIASDLEFLRAVRRCRKHRRSHAEMK